MLNIGITKPTVKHVMGTNNTGVVGDQRDVIRDRGAHIAIELYSIWLSDVIVTSSVKIQIISKIEGFGIVCTWL